MWTVSWGKDRSGEGAPWGDNIMLENEEQAWMRAGDVLSQGAIVFAINRDGKKVYSEENILSRLANEEDRDRSAVDTAYTNPSATLASMMRMRGRHFSEQSSGLPASIGLRTQSSAAVESNPLEEFFDSHVEGPGVWKWRHYFDIYHRHFAKFTGRPVHVVEVGVYSGGSLAMWMDYFGTECRIYGVDILEACKAYETDSIRIFLGDQGDRDFWKRFKAEVPIVDIVIDDGNHYHESQIVTLEELLPHMRPGGVYLCEDVYGTSNGFHQYVGGMTNQLNAQGNAKPGVSDHHDGLMTNAFQRDVHSVHLYPYVAVIEKRDAPAIEFTAPRHGTQWLPWGDAPAPPGALTSSSATTSAVAGLRGWLRWRDWIRRAPGRP